MSPTGRPAVRRAAIAAAARGWLGTPYRHQASLKGVGADCLGLVRGVWREIYGAEPEAPPAYSRDWAEAQARETLIEAARRNLVAIPAGEARAGDVVVFRFKPHLPAKHAAILTGPAGMIHAMEGGPAAEVALTPWWRRRIAAAFQLPGVCD